MHLGRLWIEQHIPHKGAMCLLDEVISWDAARICCRSDSHRAPDHPLRQHGRLGAACGIEYAAQAMAVHGALVAASSPLTSAMAAGARAAARSPRGYLASVREVRIEVERLDDLPGSLLARAERIAGGEHTVLYHFTVLSAERPLLSGRASIVMAAQP
ncbi:MAG: 3-hydroxylacyl-ACP dehydratase [Proteobacteria bacterium]|nr:3-hydroxylacyl-ACP dehydratase [Pseudomonadota bacterium]